MLCVRQIAIIVTLCCCFPVHRAQTNAEELLCSGRIGHPMRRNGQLGVDYKKNITYDWEDGTYGDGWEGTLSIKGKTNCKTYLNSWEGPFEETDRRHSMQSWNVQYNNQCVACPTGTYGNKSGNNGLAMSCPYTNVT